MPNRNRYQIQVSDTAKKNFRRLPAQDQKRVLEALNALGDDPRPRGCVALKAHMGYRIRVGDYRAIYAVDDAAKMITVLAVKHRREAYRDL